MSRLRANQITNQSADGAPTVQNGLIVTGVCTATTFKGDGSQLTGVVQSDTCLLYTSDAADEGHCVDLGGRRIIKKNFFF